MSGPGMSIREECLKEVRAKGRAEGRAEGLEEGLAKGKAEGIEEGKKEMALRMKAEGIPVEIIARCSGLSAEEIEAL